MTAVIAASIRLGLSLTRPRGSRAIDSVGVGAYRRLTRVTRRVSGTSQQQASALQAGRRMVSRGEHPAYRLRMAQDGRWTVREAPWLDVGTLATAVEVVD